VNLQKQRKLSISMRISIIIPVYNEEHRITELLHYLRQHSNGNVADIITVDGGSSDKTVEKVRETGFECLQSKQKGRAMQMNTGARKAAGDILYFVHADTFPPESYESDIISAVENGYQSGCYRFRFDSDQWQLKINSWFTRFDVLMCRGGDQSLFVTKNLFENLGGFKNMVIMEDFELIRRLRKQGEFRVIPKDVIVSCRKYQTNTYLKINLINLVIFMMFVFGASDQTMVHAYKQLIRGTRFGPS